MRKKIFFYLLCSFIFFYSSLFCQSTRGGNIYFDIDMLTFRASDDYTYLEVLISIPRSSVEYQERDSIYISEFSIVAYLYDGDSLIAKESKNYIDKIKSKDSIKKGQSFLNDFPFFLKSGQYRLNVIVKDLNVRKEGWYKRNLDIVAYSRKDLDISDIQFCTEVVPDTGKGRFIKNGYRIHPNPSNLFGLEIPVLYYYCEIYNLSSLAAGKDSTYTVNITILDLNNNPVNTLPSKVRMRMGESLVEVGNIFVNNLHSGSYQLVTEVIDNGTGNKKSSEKSFFIYRNIDFIRKPQTEEEISSLSDEYSGLTEEELDEEFEYCYYLVTRKEKKAFKKLNLDGKRNFLKQFWRKLDKDPLTPVNEFKQEYYQRVNYANSKFSTGLKKGWKTDQGNIFIIYGEPDEIERYPSNLNQNPYEIWHYFSIEGGIFFVFVDTENLGEMRMVHSTSRDQIYDPEWERWLTR
jgi:GWxTD domain-containing protein